MTDADDGSNAAGWPEPPVAAPMPGTPEALAAVPDAADTPDVDLSHLAGGRTITVTGPMRWVVIALLAILIAVLSIGTVILEFI